MKIKTKKVFVKLKQSLKIIKKLFIIKLCFTIFVGFSFLIKTQYKKRIPIENVGTCIVFNLSSVNPNFGTQIVAGKIEENSFKEGAMIVSTKMAGFLIPFEINFYNIREDGYIKVDCNEIE